MKIVKFLSFFMLAIVQKNDVCAASASRSLISRVITSARNHPIMTAAGLVGTGYLFYTLLHKKRALLPSHALPEPRLGEQAGTAFLGKQVHNFGKEGGRPLVFIALPNNRFASGHENGVVKIWNAETRQCEQTIKIHESVLSLCLVGSARMVVSTSSGNLYLLELDNREVLVKLIGGFGSLISAVSLLFDEKVILNFDEDRLGRSAEVFDTKTGEHYPFYVQSVNKEFLEVRISFIVQLDPDRFLVVSREQKGWFGVISTESVRRSYDEQRGELSKTKEFVLRKGDFQFTVPNDELIYYAAVLHDNTLILVSWDGAIRIFDGSNGSSKEKLKTSLVSNSLGRRRPVYSISEFSKNAIIIAVDNAIDRHMCVLSRDEQGHFKILDKKYEGFAPLLLLPQGLVASSPEGEIRLVQ